ncbi:hypothetical protein FHG87_024494 [Trinorchestia longiramus]|nr:hypothetical protein FHG87_024494 [Trinorchestia longiramus]
MNLQGSAALPQSMGSPPCPRLQHSSGGDLRKKVLNGEGQHHQLGRLVSESAYERKDPGSNPAADMVDAAIKHGMGLGRAPGTVGLQRAPGTVGLQRTPGTERSRRAPGTVRLRRAPGTEGPQRASETVGH